MKNSQAELYRLEQLAAGATVLHRLHPLAKLLGVLCYLICLLSLPADRLGQLLSFLLIPVVLMALGELPWGLIARRTAVALPFCLMAGLSNLILDRQVLFFLGALPVTEGLVSCLGILVRTVLCVSAVLLLVALTPFSQLMEQLRRLHMPEILVRLFEMTYRYVGTLLEEAGTMTTAYRLRAGDQKGLKLRHMGSFVGMLLIRSYDRARRVLSAMECRGYGGVWGRPEPQKMAPRDYMGLLGIAGSSVLLRLVDVPGGLGRSMICWM